MRFTPQPASETETETDTSFESPNIGRLEFAKKWAWHHLEGGHAPLTEKAPLLLELIWSLS